jgi:type III secretory pathway component EscU
MLDFADDTFIPSWNASLLLLIEDMQKKIEGFTKWLKKSGLVVREGKTKICLFYKRDMTPVTLKINNSLEKSKKVTRI